MESLCIYGLVDTASDDWYASYDEGPDASSGH